MPSTSTRVPPRRETRRPLGRGFTVTPPAPVRPLAAPFAAAFGLLVAVEDGCLGWLLRDAVPGWGRYLPGPAALAVLAITGAVLVLRGRPLGRWASGSAVLALACLLPPALLQGPAASSRAVGGRRALSMLLAGPLGGLVLGLQRPVRDWTRRRPVSSRGRGRRSG